MRESDAHKSTGLVAHLRNPATGESITVKFAPGVKECRWALHLPGRVAPVTVRLIYKGENQEFDTRLVMLMDPEESVLEALAEKREAGSAETDKQRMERYRREIESLRAEIQTFQTLEASQKGSNTQEPQESQEPKEPQEKTQESQEPQEKTQEPQELPKPQEKPQGASQKIQEAPKGNKQGGGGGGGRR